MLITGANGFIGGSLARILSERSSWRIVLGARGPIAEHNGVDRVVLGGLEGPKGGWPAGLERIDTVVHCAGLGGAGMPNAPPGDLHEINVVGLGRFAQEAAQRGVRRFIFLSTVKVHGEKNPNDRPFDESDAPSPQSSYGKSKLSAEHELYAVAKSTGMEIVILRPVMVYGPGTRGNLQALARVAVLGIPLPFGSIENARSLLSIFNLADFVSAVVHHPAAANEVFLVSDGEDVSTPDLFRLLARMRGRRLRLLPVPLAPMRLLATLAGRAADFDRLTESLSVNSSKASRVLGWQPTLSLEEGLRRTLRDEDLGARRHL